MYRNRTTGEIFTANDLKHQHPNTSLPKVWNASTHDFLDVDPILDSPKPDTGELQTAYKDGAVQDGLGNWVWKWSIRDTYSDQLDENNQVVKTKAEAEAEHLAKKEQARQQAIKAEMANKITESIEATGQSKTMLLMKAIGLTHTKQGRPLDAGEQAKETELLNIMAQVEALETIADTAIANNTPVDQVPW